MSVLLRDLRSGWRARPSSRLSLAAVGCAVGALSALGFQTWHRASEQSIQLLEAWPADRTTLGLTESLGPAERLYLLSRLPEGTWWAWKEDPPILWIAGTLPRELTPAVGSALSPDAIRQGQPAGVAAPHTGWSPGEVRRIGSQVFQVWGVNPLPGTADILLPWSAGHSDPFPYEHVQIDLPANKVKAHVLDLPMSSSFRLIDHQQQREAAQRGFRRLTLQLTLFGCSAALLTALILHAVVRFELQERRSEFALRRSLGATPAIIQSQILTETFFTAGIPSAFGILFLLPSLPLTGLYLLMLVPGWFVLCALPPAHRAAHLPPHEALKEA